jgi:acyl-CoA dehydrogenase
MPALSALAFCLVCGLLLATRRAPQWAWALALFAITLAGQIGLLKGSIGVPSLGPLGLLSWVPALTFGVLSIPALRREVLIAPIFHFLRRAMPRVSDTARQTLGGGAVGFESEFFGGKPDWGKLRAVPPITLTDDERAFLDGPTEDLCRMINDWQIRHQKEIPAEVWSFLKNQGFLGIRISKTYGGLGFSAQALSLVLGKVASRSPDVFTIVMIPNSLGLGELIEAYGTDEQRNHYLPRLAKGQDIPCLALTGPTSGSDAATMRDIGTITCGNHKGADTIGIRVSWDKRYITLAPDATLIGLAFRLFDPDNLLGKGVDVGITVALVPADHAGVNIGRRHLASGAAFPNGPTSGKDVFIPLDWVIGGETMAGQGWRMLMDCVSASRAISLPACAAAGAKSMLRSSTAYGRIRRQFGSPIAKMEGVEEPLARMIETAYVNEAGRAVTAAMVSRGEKPSVISALMKYQTTERLRRSVNDAMDLHGGRAVCDGPANYLQSAYQMMPAAITVEGANIVTRALITFTQGALRSHPYLGREMQACQDQDAPRGLAAFEEAMLGHISFSLANVTGAFLHNITGGRFAKVPKEVLEMTVWHRQLWRASHNFAFVADLTVMLLGGSGLRRRQKLTGRMADALSELYLLACVLKRYEDDAAPADDRVIVAFAAQNGLYRFQEALRGTINNFPVAWARHAMKAVVFPLGSPYRPAQDRLGHKIVELALQPGETRDRLTRYIYVSKDVMDPTGLLEVTLEKVVQAEEAEKKLERAVRRRTVLRLLGTDWIGDAVTQGVITEGEAGLLREIETLTARVIAVDDFDPDEVRPNYMTAGHNRKAAQVAAAE